MKTNPFLKSPPGGVINGKQNTDGAKGKQTRTDILVLT